MKNKAGQPRKFQTPDELRTAYFEFLTEIAENGFEVSPTNFRFALWYSKKHKDVDQRTIFNTVNTYFPELKKELEQYRSDVMVEGASKGAYHAAVTIFGLKNWCGWTDRPVEQQQEKTTLDDLVSAIRGLSDENSR